MSVFPELEPIKATTEYIPRVFGFRVHGKKGSTFQEILPKDEMYYYGEEHIKRLTLQQHDNLHADYEDNDEDYRGKNVLPQNILSDLNEPVV